MSDWLRNNYLSGLWSYVCLWISVGSNMLPSKMFLAAGNAFLDVWGWILQKNIPPYRKVVFYWRMIATRDGLNFFCLMFTEVGYRIGPSGNDETPYTHVLNCMLALALSILFGSILFALRWLYMGRIRHWRRFWGFQAPLRRKTVSGIVVWSGNCLAEL